MSRLLIVYLAVFSLSCKNSQQGNSQDLDYKKIAQEQLEGYSKLQENEANSHILIIKEHKSVNAPQEKTFLVISKETGNVVLDKSKVNGEVSWHKDETLLINPQNRVAPDKDGKLEDNAYLINIITKKRSKRGIKDY